MRRSLPAVLTFAPWTRLLATDRKASRTAEPPLGGELRAAVWATGWGQAVGTEASVRPKRPGDRGPGSQREATLPDS